MLMETRSISELVDYGIFNEISDYRLHVCPQAKRIYIFPTAAAREALAHKNYPKRPAYTGTTLTAYGYLVPPADIPHCYVIQPLPDFWKIATIREDMTTSEKGNAAVMLVKAAFEGGLIPIHLAVEIVTDYNDQQGGLDVKVQGHARLQVKCDLRGGEKEAGGTGNLFLQVAEINLHKQY